MAAPGAFGGHALPGSFFIIFALWWTPQIFLRYASCKRRNMPFVSSVTFPFHFLCGRVRYWPIEGILKIVATTIGAIFEIIAGSPHRKFVLMANRQHMTMFCFFWLSGVVDVLCYCNVPLPPDLDYISMTMAFTIEWVLFNFHLYGRTLLDTQLHTLLVYVMAATIIACLLEMRFRKNVLAPLARAYFILLQGTWLYQIGYILYPPISGVVAWDEEDHDQMMLSTLYFAWHCAANFIIMILIGIVVHIWVSQKGASQVDDMKRIVCSGKDGQTFVSLNHSDTESDVEFAQLPVNAAVVSKENKVAEYKD